MGSLDLSQNQNGNSIRFSSQKNSIELPPWHVPSWWLSSSSNPYQPGPFGPDPRTIMQLSPASLLPTSMQSFTQLGLHSLLMVAAEPIETKRVKAMKVLILESVKEKRQNSGTEAELVAMQGWDGSRYRFDRTWIEMNSWFCIWFGEPISGYLYFKRYFFPILQIHVGVPLDTEPVSGSG